MSVSPLEIMIPVILLVVVVVGGVLAFVVGSRREQRPSLPARDALSD